MRSTAWPSGDPNDRPVPISNKDVGYLLTPGAEGGLWFEQERL